MSSRGKTIVKVILAVLMLAFWIAVFSMRANGQTLRDCVSKSYTHEIGVREATGHNDGVDVEKYLASTNLTKGYAWCAAFVNWNLAQCGATHNNSAWCPDWFPRHRIVWVRSTGLSGSHSGTLPQKGDVFGIYFPDKKRIAHVGFIDEWRGNSVVTVEGNTNAAGSRNGEWSMRKIRLTKQIYKVANWIDL